MPSALQDEGELDAARGGVDACVAEVRMRQEASVHSLPAVGGRFEQYQADRLPRRFIMGLARALLILEVSDRGSGQRGAPARGPVSP